MKIRMQSDEELLMSVQEGDRNAYTSIFHRYYRPLVLFAFSFVKDREVAEDIVQNFFCKIWENRKKMASVSNCKSYFYTSIGNLSRNYLRDLKLVPAPIPERGEEDKIQDLIAEEEIYINLIKKIEQLPTKCRGIILMKMKGAENREIADFYNITEETVRSQIRRAKDILKEQLKGYSLLAYLLLLIDIIS